MDSTKLKIVLRTAYLFCFVDWPCGWFFFFFCLLTSPGLLRNGRSGAEKRTRSVSLRSNSIFQHRPTIPPLTPLRLGRSFLRQDASLLAFYSEKAALQYLLEC